MARRRNQKNKVQNVRIVDPLSGTDALKVDRQLSSMQNSAGQVQVLVSGSLSYNSSATDANDNISWSGIAGFDEFTSFAGQYNTFRIRSIRFDIYDLSPNTAGSAYFSTFHDQFTQGTQPSFIFNDVVDGVDSCIVPPGTGKASLTWVGHTSNERGFYDVTPPVLDNTVDFGGLRMVRFQGPATSVPRWRVAVKAVVDFRGRR